VRNVGVLIGAKSESVKEEQIINCEATGKVTVLNQRRRCRALPVAKQNTQSEVFMALVPVSGFVMRKSPAVCKSTQGTYSFHQI
jgi:hypothetical protein